MVIRSKNKCSVLVENLRTVFFSCCKGICCIFISKNTVFHVQFFCGCITLFFRNINRINEIAHHQFVLSKERFKALKICRNCRISFSASLQINKRIQNNRSSRRASCKRRCTWYIKSVYRQSKTPAVQPRHKRTVITGTHSIIKLAVEFVFNLSKWIWEKENLSEKTAYICRISNSKAVLLNKIAFGKNFGNSSFNFCFCSFHFYRINISAVPGKAFFIKPTYSSFFINQYCLYVFLTLENFRHKSTKAAMCKINKNSFSTL